MPNFARPAMTLDEMIREYNRILNDQHIEKLEALRNAFQGFDAKQGIGSQTLGGQPKSAPRWNSVEEMMRDLDAQKKRQVAARPKPIDKNARIKEIEHELDIIRGRIPTPKGYTIDKSRVRTIIKELQELQKS